MACRKLLMNNILSRFIPTRSLSGVVSQRVTKTAGTCYEHQSPTSQCTLTSVPVRRITTSSTAVDAAAAATDSDFTALTEQVNTQLMSRDAGRLFAVVHVAGKQRKVTAEDIIILDKHIAADIGQRIRLNKVMLVGGRDFTVVGRPVLSVNAALVEATVIEKTLSHAKICFWYHRRRNYKKFKLRRYQFTFLRINSIDLAPIEDS